MSEVDKNTLRSILVTGGVGYIGSHLVAQLLAAGHRVTVLDNLSYGDAGLAAVRNHPALRFIHGDICDLRAVTRAVKGNEIVIALAAIVGDPACKVNVDETVNVNYQATKVLIEECHFQGVKRIVFASSCSVYGANSDIMLNERSWLNPVSLYARTRIMSEEVLLQNRHRVTPVILRLATVFGWSARMRFDLSVNFLTAKAVCEGRIQIYGGNQWRPYVHVKDAAQAFMLAALVPEKQVAGEIFNVGSNPENYQIRELGEAVCRLVPGTVMEICEEEEDRRDYRVAFDKIGSTLGFEAHHNVRDGILEIAEHLRKGGCNYKDNIYYNVKYLYQDV